MTRPLTPWLTVGPMRARLEFKVADLWVGMFWRKTIYAAIPQAHIWLCLLPMLPIHIEVTYAERHERTVL